MFWFCLLLLHWVEMSIEGRISLDDQVNEMVQIGQRKHIEGDKHNSPGDLSLTIRMPSAVPEKADDYLCTEVELPFDEGFIVGYTPLGDKGTAHHMLIKGSTERTMPDPIWLCGFESDKNNRYPNGRFGDGGGRGDPFIYAWANNATPLKMPKGVGFKVGKNTLVKYLVLQVHYAHPLETPDDSGVIVHISSQPQPKRAGIALLGSAVEIPPKKTTKMDMACSLLSPATLYPFAFRTHAHNLGVVISGFRVIDGKRWELLGKMDPHRPQTFYPIARKNMKIKQGDTMAGRCVFKSDRETVTYIGPRNADEMCNFYIMYYTHGEQDVEWSPGCYARDTFKWGEYFRNVPEKAASSFAGHYYPAEYHESPRQW